MNQSHESIRRATTSDACRLALISILLLISPQKSHAQVFDFRTFGTKDGLISNSVAVLCQDSLGYLWVGSGDGISVFDGETATNYTVADGLPSSFVNAMLPDSKKVGKMWIGTNGGGLSEFYGGRFTNYVIGNNQWSDRINSLAEGPDGTIYCGTDDGIFTFRNGKSSRVEAWPARSPADEITFQGDSLLVLDGHGVLSAVSLRTGGIDRIAGKFNYHSPVSFFTLDLKKRMWISLDDGTLLEFAGRSIRRAVLPEPALFLFDDRYDNIWVGTVAGIFRFSAADFGKSPPTHLSETNGLPENEITAGIADKEGDIWFGTSSHGICELSNQNSCTFPLKYSDIALNNSQGASDAQGHVWAVENSSLLEVWLKKSGLFEVRHHPFKDLGIAGVNAGIHITDGNALWICDSSGIIRRFMIHPEPPGGSRLTLERSYFVNKLFHHFAPLCFYVDEKDRIWYSLSGVGIVEFSAKSGLKGIHIYNLKNILPDNSVRSIFEDSHGNVWFGGYIGGLVELPSTLRIRDLKLYTTRNGLPDNSVRAIVEDDSGNLWIGTRYGGVALFREGRFKPISVKNGLISDGIWSEAYDGRYGVLFATQGGLQLLEERSRPPEIWRRFGERTTQFSCGITSTGLLWGCSTSGLSVSDLTRERDSGVPPGVNITGVLVNGTKKPVGGVLRLPYDENTITFDFAGVSLRDERALGYRYRLGGTDEKWRLASQIHSITYVSLKPGKYLFEVRALKPSGIESVAAATVRFLIIPPLWDRWWFIAAGGLLLVALAYSGIKFRVNKLLEIGRVRSRIATDLHDEIGSGLTRIAMLADFAVGETAAPPGNTGSPGNTEEAFLQIRNVARRIGSSARDLIDSMSDVIWSIDPKYDSLSDFLFYFRTYANELTEAKGISLEIETGEIENARIGPQVKRTLQLMSKEALTNAVKYSGCRKIRYGLSGGNRLVSIYLEDDGCGFDPKRVERGHGLNNMEKHAHELNGDLVIDSSPGKGTRIMFSFRISGQNYSNG